MAVDRKTPTVGNPPAGGNDGTSYTGEVNEEVAALWDRVPIVLTQSGGPNSITASGNPTVTELVAGMNFRMKFTQTTTAAFGIDIDSLGEVPVVRRDGSASQSGDGVANAWADFIYDGTSLVMMSDAGALALAAEVAIFKHQQNDGVNGGDATSGAYNRYPFNNTAFNGIAGCSIDTVTNVGNITLPPGEYIIKSAAVFYSVDNVTLGIYDEDLAQFLAEGVRSTASAGVTDGTSANNPIAVARLSLSAIKTISCRYRVQTTKAGTGIGFAVVGTEPEHYGWIEIIKLVAAETGPAGPPLGFRLTFDDAVADADPGTGMFRLDNATLGSVTKIWMDNQDNSSVNITTWIDRMDDSTVGTDKGRVRFEDVSDPTNYLEFTVTGTIVDKSGYREIPVSGGTGAIFADGTIVAATFQRSGDNGTSSLSSVTENVIPDSDGTRDIGSSANNFNDGYFKDLFLNNVSLFPLIAQYNLVRNSHFLISQENGDSGGQIGGYHPADEWQLRATLTTAAVTLARTALPFADTNIPYGLQVSINTPDAAPATGNHLTICHMIEGVLLRQARWGFADALDITVQFVVRTNHSGTYVLSAINNGGNRCYAQEFSVSANTDTLITLTIPGDTTGTWAIDTNPGLALYWALDSGSTYEGTADTWDTPIVFSTTGSTNFLATGTNTFTIGPVFAFLEGIPILPLAGAGLPFVHLMTRDVIEDQHTCERYYRQLGQDGDVRGAFFSATQATFVAQLNPRMRGNPIATMIDTSPTVFDEGAVANVTASGCSISAQESSVHGMFLTVSGFSGRTVGNTLAFRQNAGSGGPAIGLSARMTPPI